MRTLDLLRWALGKVDTSLNVGLETLDGFFKELLLVVIGALQDVDGFLSTLGLHGS